ncbi:MAG TPA: hypothetical protein DCO83_04320 [Mucilaginibacter sp.]|nr:hypothetical protein [Mucilaginibacter sp.]
MPLAADSRQSWDTHQKIHLRSASDFPQQLNVHVNHLNRAVKENTQKTTTQIIASRFLQESKILLKHSSWSVSEIACALGFTEVTHFPALVGVVTNETRVSRI